MNKRGTHLADSFFIPNSYKIEITVPCDMPMISTSSHIFTRRSIKIISWMISGVAASIGRGASHVDVRPHLKSFIQLYTVANAGAMNGALSNLALIYFGVKLHM